ncbi:Glycoside hydrolase family 71 [Penicillium soppii]|uniref:Glycoside hydrolase family 71 n=1 Tax=Penicillium soppii TaxID=69789 RepID=UPI002546DC63|nr:Glycoside hydrolase family 71 [Penicillium soppii]KAJ5852373.1 Glycoside hydrolase family 71 [Penicillium soppii]
MKPPTILFILSLWKIVHHVQAAAVFAHFMVYNSENFTLYDWEINIAEAQKAHLDAFALNLAYNFPTNNRSLENAFKAANTLHFKLLFSFDYVGNGAWPEGDVIAIINRYKDNPAYYQHKGKPFVSTFEGSANATDWSTIKKYADCFFVPGWSGLGAKEALAVAPGVPDGLFSWAAWPEGSDPINTYIDSTYMQWLKDAGDLPYMMPVSPWFYTNLPGYDKNWIWNGDNLWYDRWQQVLSLKPEFVEIISWNDYGESHYIGPLHDDAYATFEIGNASYNYAADYPHDGWRDFLPFIIELYKTGNSNIKSEGVTAWFRQAPGKACTNGGTMGNTETHGQKLIPPTDVLLDEVFYSALLHSSAAVDVVVDIGGVTQDGKWKNKPTGQTGLYHGSVPFDGNTGQVVVTVSRRGKAIAEMRGASISNSCLDDIQNWNAWVGSDFGKNLTKNATQTTTASHAKPTSSAVSAAPALLALARVPFTILFVALVATMVSASLTHAGHNTLSYSSTVDFSTFTYAGVPYSFGNGYYSTESDALTLPFTARDIATSADDSSWEIDWSFERQ